MRAACVVGLLLLGAANLSSAHHSYAMFDAARVVTLEGRVREFQWTNPHCFIQIEVESGGQTVEWSVEMLSPGDLARKGWRPGSVQPGDRLRVELNPVRDGTSGGMLIAAWDAQGRQLPLPRVPQ